VTELISAGVLVAAAGIAIQKTIRDQEKKE
jgi:hypothetical protein